MDYQKILRLYSNGPEGLSSGELWELKGHLNDFLNRFGIDDETLGMLEDVNLELGERDKEA